MQAGLMNTYQHPVSNRQPVAWLCSAVLVVAYVLLYFGGNPYRGFAADPIQRLAEGIAGALSLPKAFHSKWVLYGVCYTLAMIAGRGLRHRAPRQQPLPARSHERRGRGAGSARVRAAPGDEGLHRPRALLLVLLAPQDRVPLPGLHPAAAVPDPGLVVPRLARGLSPARLLLRQALLLLVDLRLRRPRQHRGRALPAPLRQVAPRPGASRRSRSTPCSSSRSWPPPSSG